MIIGKEYKDKFLPHWEKWKRVTFRGYNYGGIIANQLGSLHHTDTTHFKNKFRFLTAIKQLIKNLIYTPTVFTVNTSNLGDKLGKRISFLMEEDGRSDYQQQCQFVLSDLEDYNLQIFTIPKKLAHKKRVEFNAFAIKLILFLKLLISVPIVSGFKIDAFAKNILLISKCLYCFDFIQYINKNNILVSSDLMIVFSDMKEYGNIFVQFAKQKKIPTATLQHGIYIKQDDTNFSQSSINYLNSSSDYILGWGNSIDKIFENTGKKGVLLSGTSVSEYDVKNFYNTAKNSTEANNTFVVLFSRNILRESNLKMLSIGESVATAKGLKYDVLMHPSNKPEDYSFDKLKGLNKALKGSSNLISLIDQADFCICHSTTVYFTVLLKRKKCFRLKDDLFIDYGGLNDTVTNSDELLVHLENDAQMRTVDRDKEVEELLIYHFGEAGFSYKQSVKTILSDKIIYTAAI